MTHSIEELDNSMVRVPAGPFVFGMTEQQKLAAAEQAGVHPDALHFHSNHNVLTTREFWIDTWPATRGQFKQFRTTAAMNRSCTRAPAAASTELRKGSGKCAYETNG